MDATDISRRDVYAVAEFTGLTVGTHVRLSASATIDGVRDGGASGTVGICVTDPEFRAQDVVAALAAPERDDEHCWVLFHRRDGEVDQFRLDVLRVYGTGQPVPFARLVVDGTQIPLNGPLAPDGSGDRFVSVWVDGRTDSVHVAVSGGTRLSAVSVRTDLGDGSPLTTDVDLEATGSPWQPAALMIVGYIIQGLNDLFWHPIGGVNDHLLQRFAKNGSLDPRSARAVYQQPRNFARIIYRDEHAAFSGIPGKEESGRPDGYSYMIEALQRFGIRSVWAFNAGALLLLRHGLPQGQWQQLVTAVSGGWIPRALAGFGAHRAAYYRAETNRREIVENAGIIARLLQRPGNGVYFGDSRIYKASTQETTAFRSVGALVRYLVLERSTLATCDPSAPTGERLLFPGQDVVHPDSASLWQDEATGLRILLAEDVLRNHLTNPSSEEIQRGLAPRAVRRLLMEAFVAGRQQRRLLVVADDIEHFCGAGWFDGQDLDFAAGFAAAAAWIAGHPWVESVVPDALEDGSDEASPFPARSVAVSSSIDATIDADGASVRSQDARINFDLWHRAWDRSPAAWLGSTLGEISRRLEEALIDWPARAPHHDTAMHDLAWLYFLSCTHENCWSKRPTDTGGTRDDPFAWDPEDFVVSESIQVRNAWVYLNASIWGGAPRPADQTSSDHVISDATIGNRRAGWLPPLLRAAHSADRWWAPHDPMYYDDDGLYWDQDNLRNVVLYNEDLLAVIDLNGGVITHLFTHRAGRTVSVSGTCKAYQFLTLNPQIPSDGPRMQNTVFTPNHAYVASDVRQARPWLGDFEDQRKEGRQQCWWPNNHDRYDCAALPDRAGVRLTYATSSPDTLPTEPLAEDVAVRALIDDGRRLREGLPGVVWHRDPGFSKDLWLDGRTLHVRYRGVRPDHVVANEFSVDLLRTLRGGPGQRVQRGKDEVSFTNGGTRVTVRTGDGARFTDAAEEPAEALRRRILTGAVLIAPEEAANGFDFTVEIDGPTR